MVLQIALQAHRAQDNPRGLPLPCAAPYGYTRQTAAPFP